jgi:NitT/TauT family transport system permease protein
LFLIGFLIAWEVFTGFYNSVLIPSPAGTARATVELLFEAQTWESFWLSNQSLAIGFVLAVSVGVVVGLIIGRVAWMEKVLDPWLGFLLVLPMSMLMPIIIMTLGFSLTARVLVVFLFSVPVIIVNTRAGIREVPAELIEMGRVFGASELDLWKQIFVKSAAPAMWTGFRSGLARAITGMVLGELLLVAVGIGMLFQLFQGEFNPDRTFGLVALLIAESLILLKVLRIVERRMVPWLQVDKFENH